MWQWMNARRRVDRSSMRWHVLMEMENWINFLRPQPFRLLFPFLFISEREFMDICVTRAVDTNSSHWFQSPPEQRSPSDVERCEKCYNFLSERCAVWKLCSSEFLHAYCSQPAIWAESLGANLTRFNSSSLFSSRLILLINIYISNLSMYIFTPHWWNHHPHRILMSKNISFG